jgi:PAS domain S-box-containing protein
MSASTVSIGELAPQRHWRAFFPLSLRIFAAAWLLATVVYYALPVGVLDDTIYYPLFGFCSAGAILAGIAWHKPRDPYPWLLFAAGQLAFAIGDVLFGIYVHVLHDDSFPTPSDGFYLAGYPLLAAGLSLLLRQRTTRRDWGTLLDASTLTVALGIAGWVLLMVRYTTDDSLSTVETVFSIFYPLGDVLLAAVVVRLLLDAGARTTSYLLLAAAVFFLLLADPLNTILALKGDYGQRSWIDTGWILSYACFAAAALHPSMRTISDPAPDETPKLTPLRLAVLAGACLVAPALLVYKLDYVAVAGAAALSLLVVVRLSGIVGSHRRALTREARLRAAAARLVAATSDEEIHRAAVETAAGFIGETRACATLVVGERTVAVAGACGTASTHTEYPIVVRDQRLGTLVLDTESGIAREVEQALETLAVQVALALETVARAREAQQRASEARFRSLVQNSSDVIAIVDRETTIRYLTPSVESTLGYDADVLAGRALRELVHPEDADRLHAAAAEAIAIGGLHAVEVRLRHADGRWVDTETLVNAQLDDETIGGLVLTTRDVTVRKQFEASEAERARVRDVFSRFVPEAVVEELLLQTGGSIRLGGETRTGTIMFTDLRGFTTFSESRPAEEVIEVVNRFLSEQTDAIMANGGTIIAYMGDGIMAAFGAPIEQDDHADRALAAARELVGVRLPALNAWMRERGLGDGFRMGVGLNSGSFVSGNVGHERRLEYTAIGDVTNTAARIQELTKGTPHMLLFSDPTLEALASQPDDLVAFGDAEIRGRKAAARLWSLASVSDR